jgi:hypothetical protein
VGTPPRAGEVDLSRVEEQSTLGGEKVDWEASPDLSRIEFFVFWKERFERPSLDEDG